jgi:hypothetical protein
VGRVIVTGLIIIVLVAVVAFLYVWHVIHRDRHEDKIAGRAIRGDLDAKQEQEMKELLTDAASIFETLGVNSPDDLLGDYEVIRNSTRQKVMAWQDKNRKRTS